MINITTQVSGSEIGRELRNDEEELAFALMELAKAKDSLGEEVACHLTREESASVADALVALAEAIRRAWALA